METILSIPRELEYLESLVKLARKKHDESIKFINVIGVEGMLAIRKWRINKNHHSKTMHLFVEINNNLLEGLMDTSASMSVMAVGVVRELRMMHLVAGTQSY